MSACGCVSLRVVSACGCVSLRVCQLAGVSACGSVSLRVCQLAGVSACGCSTPVSFYERCVTITAGVSAITSMGVSACGRVSNNNGCVSLWVCQLVGVSACGCVSLWVCEFVAV